MNQVIKNIADELDLVVSKKNKPEDHCWACGPKGDTQKLGDERFMLTANITNAEGNPDLEYLEFCPRHFSFLLNIAYTHLMRVEKGKAKGPLSLPQVAQAGEGI